MNKVVLIRQPTHDTTWKIPELTIASTAHRQKTRTLHTFKDHNQLYTRRNARKDQRKLTKLNQRNNVTPQTRNASTVQEIDANVLEHIRSQKTVTDARRKVGSAILMTKNKGQFSLQKKNVINVAKLEDFVTEHTHLLKYAAHAKL